MYNRGTCPRFGEQVSELEIETLIFDLGVGHGRESINDCHWSTTESLLVYDF